MPINSLVTGLVGFAGPETTVPTTQMAGGSASVAVSQAEEAYQTSLQNGTNSLLNGTIVNQFLTSQATVGMFFQNTVNGSWPNTLSASPWQLNAASNIQPTMTNSSMNTKTKKESPNAYKPVTLTLTGQLKPSILTEVPRPKSSPSTKHPMPSLNQLLGGDGW